jgi:outer membrane protein TolC
MRSRFLVFCFVVVPAAVWAGPPLTLSRVQQLALESQPSLTAIEAGARAAREGAVAEGQLPDPRLKLGIANVPEDSFALNRDSMTTSYISIEQMFPGGDKRDLRRRRGEAEADQLAAELATQRHVIRRDAALAYLDVVGAQRQIALLKELQSETRRQVEAARINTLSGKAGTAEALAARRMATMARDRESELRLQAARARAELSRWIGAAAEDEVADTPPDWPPPPSLAQMKAQLDAHPAHAAQARSVTTAEADLALAREATKPDKSIEIGYGARATQFTNMVSIQFSMDLPLAPRDRQDRGVAARKAQVERAQAMEQDHLRMLAAELAALYAQWELVRERLQRMDAELLPDAAQRVEAALAAYRAGRGELAAVLEARSAEVEARLTRAGLATQAERARLQLAYFEHAGENHER